MAVTLINPTDSLERQNEKLLQIAQSLMRRVEQKNEQSGLAYQQFERAALLESEVRERTHDLERALDLLQESNTRLEIANGETEAARSNLTDAIETINEGFALFEPGEGMVLSNSRFCRDFADISGQLTKGLSFEDYVTLISKSSALALPEGQTPADWLALRMERHGDRHVVFNVRLEWDRWLQVSEHRTSRGSTVILQTDVTTIIRRERRQRAKMRDQQAEMLQATLDHLNQGVCIFDSAQMLVGWNSRMNALFRSPAHTAGPEVNFTALMERLKGELAFEPGFDADQLQNWADRRVPRVPINFEVSRGNGEAYSVFAQEIPDQGFVLSFTDVTAERATARTLFEMNELLEQRVADRTHELGLALAEAERANASKTRFVVAASHDLLQPLSAAKLFVASISEQKSAADVRDISKKAEMALSSVEQIISDLLDISKLDAGRAVFDVQPLQLSKILTPLRNELMPLAEQKGIDLRIVDCGLSVESDPGYLRRIVQNLLTNAIRYTETGRVLVGVRRTAHSARIEVWDTGRGIAQEDQQTIFREFERLSPANADTGLGLGLAIVERACTGLDHPLSLWSKPGVGSCFSFNVPIRRHMASEEMDQEAGSPTMPPRLSDGLMMLVEDNPQLAKALVTMIESFGVTVIHSSTAEEALDILAEIQLVPDALLVDYQLGSGLNGTQFLSEAFQRFGPVPAAIISAERTKDLREACRELSVPLIAKPIEKSRIQQLLVELFLDYQN